MTRSAINRPSHSIHVELGARSYAIVIRRDLLQEIGEELKRLKCAGKVGVVTDRNLAKHYLPQVTRRLKAAGFTVVPIVLPPGERTKTLRSIGTVMDALVNARFERSSTLLALGGGVIGDITGFAAAIYQRGIPFVQMPTSLVAQVDSSVGGKTGCRSPQGEKFDRGLQPAARGIHRSSDVGDSADARMGGRSGRGDQVRRDCGRGLL
jgi:3-dehydroquinate synthetase